MQININKICTIGFFFLLKTKSFILNFFYLNFVRITNSHMR